MSDTHTRTIPQPPKQNKVLAAQEQVDYAIWNSHSALKNLLDHPEIIREGYPNACVAMGIALTAAMELIATADEVSKKGRP